MTYDNQNHTDRHWGPRPKYLWFWVYGRACLLTLQERTRRTERSERRQQRLAKCVNITAGRREELLEAGCWVKKTITAAAKRSSQDFGRRLERWRGERTHTEESYKSGEGQQIGEIRPNWGKVGMVIPVLNEKECEREGWGVLVRSPWGISSTWGAATAVCFFKWANRTASVGFVVLFPQNCDVVFILERHIFIEFHYIVDLLAVFQ